MAIDDTVNKYLPMQLSDKERLRRALEFIAVVEEHTDTAIYGRLWDAALENLKRKHCEECGAGLLLGRVSHNCLIATCPTRRLILPA